jgi:membrane-associated protein
MDAQHLLQLNPVLLVAVISVLCFVEECGLPLPFAPGDIMLMIGGLAIANHEVHPVLFVGLVFLASVTGAFAGREIFARLGRPALMRLAGWLHAKPALLKAEQMVRRSGWRAVLVGRLIPGLRVHTTQIAGVSQMPRTAFLRGLVPAAAIYITAFTTVGIVVGPSALQLLHHLQHHLFTLALVGLALAAAILLGRRLVRLLPKVRDHRQHPPVVHGGLLELQLG